MKKLFLIALFGISTSICFSQASFGIQAGANIAFGKATNSESTGFFPTTFTNDPKVGLVAGVLGEIPISRKFGFRPEINFIQKGSKSNVLFSFDDVERKITLNYIEVPLNVVFNVHVGGGHFFFGLGPTFAFGISGKEKRSDPNDPADPSLNGTFKVNFDGKKSDDITAIADYDFHAKRFDAGANILAGYQLPMGIFFKLGYTYNFLNIDPNDGNANVNDRSKYKNRGFNVCAGFMFGGKKGGKHE